MAYRNVAIDPLALLLSPTDYVRLTLPDPPPDGVLAKEIEALVHGMNLTERSAAATRIKAMKGYVEKMERALAVRG